MPSYDFRCKDCAHEFALFYKSYRDYEATTQLCPNCGSEALSRVIQRVTTQSPSRDFSRMSSQEMLSVFESGDGKQVGQMFEQIGKGVAPAEALPYHDIGQRLQKGESLDKVEKGLREDAQSPKKKPDKGSSV